MITFDNNVLDMLLSFALNRVTPLLPSIVVFGLIFGFTGGSSGYSLLLVSSMSFVIFAGAAQFTTLLFLINSEPLLAIVVTAIFINLRHVLYSMILRERLEVKNYQKFILAYFILDETFLILDIASREQKQNPEIELDLQKILLMSGLIIWIMWNVSTIIGFFVYELTGSNIQFPGNFIVSASFVGFLVDHYRKYPQERMILVTTSLISVILGHFLSSSALFVTIMVVGSVISAISYRRKSSV